MSSAMIARITFIAVFPAMLAATEAAAADRVALVMGNAAYRPGYELRNPINDARDIADKLTGLGFRVMHGYGAAIDINSTYSAYWRWTKSKGEPQWQNRIPREIIDISEMHGIWGGCWYHFDTMHFEYRPELLP